MGHGGGKEFERERDKDLDREYSERLEHDRRRSDRERERDRERDRIIDRARDRAQVGMGPGKPPRMQQIARRRRTREEEMGLFLSPSERGLFDRIKAALGPREAWSEFLKCLDLYSSDVLSKAELLTLLADLFGTGHAGVLDEVRVFLNNRGALEMKPEDVWYSMPIGEIDLTQCVRCTPSYRALPEGYPILACSERGRMERAVCNDQWVSVPTGSEDFSFKLMRKNLYEEALFRCEDERYEVDMVVDNNATAIRALEPLAEEIYALREHSRGIEWQFRLDRRSLGVLHLKAIARVYGEYGAEVLELLRKNPAGAIPVVLHRLKQKDEEWRRARAELSKVWKEVMEKNYPKSLDHRSFYFKQQDKKAVTVKQLLADMRAKVDALETALRDFRTQLAEASVERQREAADRDTAAEGVEAAADGGKKEGEAAMDEDGAALAADREAAATAKTVEAAAEEGGAEPTDGAPSPSAAPAPVDFAGFRSKLRSLAPILYFVYRDVSLHRDAYALLTYAVERQASATEKGPIAELWRTCLTRFFRFPRDWYVPGAGFIGGSAGTSASDAAAAAAAVGAAKPLLILGQVVDTPYGTAVVENVRVQPGDKDAAPAVFYGVVFRWGRGTLQAALVQPSVTAPKPLPQAGLANACVPLTTAAGAVGMVKPALVSRPGQQDQQPTPLDPVLVDPSSVNAVLRLVEQAEGTEYFRSTDPATKPSPESLLFVTGTGYAFFRLHQMLVDRLATARALCAKGKQMHSAAAGGAAASSSAAAAVGGVAGAAATSAAARPGSVASLLSTGASAALGSHAAGKISAVAAATSGDLAGAVAAGAAAGTGTDGDVTMSGSHGAELDGSDSAYQHFLTALYGAIDGSIEVSKFEDECRDLMGTGAYLTFTMDRLVSGAVKQLAQLATEQVSLRLRSLWEHTQAKVLLARGLGKTPAEADRAVEEALRQYRANVANALLNLRQPNASEECFAVQYVDNPTPSAASAGGIVDVEGALPGARTACLSLRYYGKPLYDASKSSVRGFQYASGLPAYVSRLIGTNRVLLGDEDIRTIEEEHIADVVAAEAAANAKLPFQKRNIPVDLTDKDAVGAAAAAAAAGQDNLRMSLSASNGGLTMVAGSGDVIMGIGQ
jgi:hypothetical protein